MSFSRRNFLKMAGTVAVTAGAPAPSLAKVIGENRVQFPQGVASADPHPDSILLWTRAFAQAERDVELIVQLSVDSSFDVVIIEERVSADARNDHTVRVQVSALTPFTRYYYRFVAADGSSSRTGRTLTAPAPDSKQSLNLAFASCQNYEQGFLGAWQRMLIDDSKSTEDQQIHCVLHLGDFIYERYRNRAADGQSFVRRLPPFPHGARDGKVTWASTLADYRHLYKAHLDDPHLQAARARWPFICTWDDHEFSNDGYQDYNTYNEDRHFREPERKQNANRAWFEYIPARVEAPTDALKIYRSLQWGEQAEILLTDLRSYRSSPNLPPGLSEKLGLPLDAVELVEIYDRGRTYNNGNPPAHLPFGDGTHPNTARDLPPATMLGATQKQWFKQRLKTSTARWKVWANSLPALPLRLDLGSIPLLDIPDGILSADAWAGFPGELQELMRYIETQGITGLVSLSGDHHLHAAGTLAVDPAAEVPRAVAVDFNVTGISSTTHFNNVISSKASEDAIFSQLVQGEQDGETVEVWNMTMSQGVLAALAWSQSGSTQLAQWLGPNSANPGLAYVDSNAHGYGLARFSARGCEIKLVTVSSALEATGPQGSPVLREAGFSLKLWRPGEEPVLKGPNITGEPPFPY